MNRNATTHSSPHTVKAINGPNVATRQCDPTSVSAPNGPTSYAKLVTEEPSRKSMNFHTLLAQEGNGVDVAILLESVQAISERFTNTVYSFFLENGWHTPFYKDGMNAMLEIGP
ncbi:hypothetical protein Tco_0192249 [Tanacetum coccineum]